MPWVKFDDQVHDDPDIDNLSDGAFRLWFNSISWANHNLTDGFIPAARIPRLTPNFKPQHHVELVAAGRWDQAVDGIRIHAYLRYQPAAQQVLEERERERVKKQQQRDRGTRRARRGADGKFSSGASSAAAPPGGPPGTRGGTAPGTPRGTPGGSPSRRPSGSPPLPVPVPTLSSSPPSPHDGRCEPAGSAGEEDDDDQKNPSPAVPAGELGGAEAVWAKLAEVDLERFLADGGVVRWRASWLRTAAANRARDHGDDVDAWRAEGVDWPDIVDRLTAQTQADPGEDRGRVIPSAAETRARIDAADAEAAETARLDALVDALPEVERVSLEAAACEWATANWAGGEAPPAMVRSKMRALVAANGTARGAP